MKNELRYLSSKENANLRKEFNQLIKAYQDDDKNLETLYVSVFDHWLSFEEAEIELPYWAHRKTTSDLLIKCQSHCLALTEFINEFLKEIDIIDISYYPEKVVFKKYTSSQARKRNLKYYDSSKQFNPELPFVSRFVEYYESSLPRPRYNFPAILVPKYNCLIHYRDDYMIFFALGENASETKLKIKEIADKFNLHLLV